VGSLAWDQPATAAFAAQGKALGPTPPRRTCPHSEGWLWPRGIPAGIDPKIHRRSGWCGPLNPSDVIFALADDTTLPVAPSRDRPIPRSNQPVTITADPARVSDHRVRPVDPRLAQEEDEAYRRSMKDTTDVPMILLPTCEHPLQVPTPVSVWLRPTTSRPRTSMCCRTLMGS
jgi:hypothetical protein